MSSDPVSQSFLIEIMQQMEDRVDEGHGRVRQSLNDLRLEMKEGFAQINTRCTAERQRVDDHSGQLLTIRTERKVEKEAAILRRQDQRYSGVLIASFTATGVTIALFFLKAWLHL